MLVWFFVIRCLYSAVSLSLVTEQRFIRIIYYFYYCCCYYCYCTDAAVYQPRVQK